MGSKFSSLAKNAVSALAGLNVAWTVVRGTVDEYNASRDDAMSETEKLRQVRQSLASLTGENFIGLEAASDQLATDPTLGLDRAEARELQFSAKSAGFNARAVAEFDAVVPQQLGRKIAGEFRQQFAKESLSEENAIDAVTIAAGSSVSKIDELLPQIRTAAQGAGVIGASSDNILAVVAEMASITGESTGQKVKSFQETIGAAKVPELQGLNLIETIKRLRDDSGLADQVIGGNKEAGTFFASAKERVGGFMERQQQIKLAQRDDVSPVRDQLNKVLDPTTTFGRIELARRKSVAAQSQSEIAKERSFAESAFSTNSAIERSRAARINENAPASSRFVADTAARTASLFTEDENTIEGFSRFFGANGNTLSQASNLEAQKTAEAAQTQVKLQETIAKSMGRLNELSESQLDLLRKLQSDSPRPLSRPGDDR